MNTSQILATALVCIGIFPLAANAGPAPRPLFGVGLIGSYTEMEFSARDTTGTAHMPEGGVFLNFGNKMTAESGLVYHAEISGKYAEKYSEEVKDAQVDLDLGWRLALDTRNSVDLLAGGGYKYNRFAQDIDGYDIDLTSRTPFVKLAAGYNHRLNDTTVRVEAGARMAINGDTQLKLDSIYSERVDLQNRTNPFVEVTFLFNQQGELPIFASLYYNRFKYDLDGAFAIDDLDRQTRDEYGAKVGVTF